MIWGWERAKRNLVISRWLNKSLCLFVDCFNTFFPYRSIYKTRLAKAASSDTSSENFFNGTVMDNFDKRNNKRFWIIHTVHIAYNGFFYLFGCAVNRFKFLKCTVIVIRINIKRRNINSANILSLWKKILLALPCMFTFLKKIKHLICRLLAVA